MGTDSFGSDVLARLLVGGQIPLGMSLIAALIATGIGVLFAFVSYREDSLLSIGLNGVTNIFNSIPVIPLLFVAEIWLGLGRSGAILIVGLGLVGATATIPVIRSKVRLLRQRNTSLLTKEQSRNALALINASVLATTMSHLILVESALSFTYFVSFDIGSWSQTLRELSEEYTFYPALTRLLLPGFAIMLTVFRLFVTGDRLRTRFERALVAPSIVRDKTATDTLD